MHIRRTVVSPGLQFVLTAVGVRGHLFLTLSNVVVALGLSLGMLMCLLWCWMCSSWQHPSGQLARCILGFEQLQCPSGTHARCIWDLGTMLVAWVFVWDVFLMCLGDCRFWHPFGVPCDSNSWPAGEQMCWMHCWHHWPLAQLIRCIVGSPDLWCPFVMYFWWFWALGTWWWFYHYPGVALRFFLLQFSIGRQYWR